LSALNVWWMQLGIVHQRIVPPSPQENGQHERMHRELKRETARPAAASRRAQQRRFDAFRQRYNTERPHEDCSRGTQSEGHAYRRFEVHPATAIDGCPARRFVVAVRAEA